MAVHPSRDLLVPEAFEMPKHQYRAVILRQPVQHACEQEFAFVAGRRLSRGGGVGRQQITKSLRDVGEVLIEGDLTIEVALLRAVVAANLVGEDVTEDLTQPGRAFAGGAAAESWQVAVSLDEGLLDDVGGIELGAEPAFDLRLREQSQPGLEMPEQLIRRLGLPGPGGGDELRDDRVGLDRYFAHRVMTGDW